MRYEGEMKVTGTVRIVVDEPGITLKEARQKAEAYPDSHKVMFVENLEFEEWEECLELTEGEDEEE